ncbi:hypothetical protein [Bacteroidetes bacterium endosymbiont of Geopemphigus sp.]|uniref:hypothetical protein n=1 Tax=Bacteroidetes bacterium endosymbiont of Geopemphigus sp. TaxID=2047937 RepID=UPI000CCFF537|nr:hypothetical protein [Bacteroidetes bacterium endosymbiont of Geopemphigus sp.]
MEGLRGKNKANDIKIALFNYEDPVEQGMNDYKDEFKKKGLLKSYELEGRWVDIPLAKNSQVNFWANYSIRAANKNWGYDTQHGFGIGTWHEKKELFWGKAQNITSLSFRKGPSVMHRNTYSYVPNRENMEKQNPDIINYDLNNMYSFEVNDNILYEKDKKYALEGSLIYRYENQGVVPYKKSGGKVALLERMFIGLAQDLGIYIISPVIST